MSDGNNIPVAANVLGTIGTVLWCVQLVPQIWYNWRQKKTDGLPPSMMFLWAACAVPMGTYMILQKVNIPLQIQPQMFSFFSLISWGQILYYNHNYTVTRATVAVVGTALLFGGLEALFILTLRIPYNKGVTWPDLLFGAIAAVMLALGLIPPYFEIRKRNGRVVGINWFFLGMDTAGGLFSLFALAAQGTFDILGGIMYIIVVVLEGGIYLSHIIWRIRNRKLLKEAKAAGKSVDEMLELERKESEGRRTRDKGQLREERFLATPVYPAILLFCYHRSVFSGVLPPTLSPVLDLLARLPRVDDEVTTSQPPEKLALLVLTMPEGRLSRLLRAKLLRRSSTSAVTERAEAAKAGDTDTADPDLEPDGNSSLSSLSISISSPHSRRQRSQRPRPFSCASSLPVDSPGDTDFAASPAAVQVQGEPDASTLHDPSALQAAGEEGLGARTNGHDSRVVQKESARKQSSLRDQARSPGRATTGSTVAPDPAGSVPRTPTTDPAFTPTSTASISRPVSALSDASSTAKGRERLVNSGQPQLTSPPAVAVSEAPSHSTPKPSLTPATPGNFKRPSIAVRRQSLLPLSQQHLVKNLLEPGLLSQQGDQFSNPFATGPPEMVMRKVWVKRPQASATLVTVSEDDLVDDLRDNVMRKYPNSLGRSVDSPDLLIKIEPREGSNREERVLNPEESLVAVIDSYYPGGQSVQEALVIDTPQQRPAPLPSPRVYYHPSQPGNNGEYFPPMPAVNVGTPPIHVQSAVSTGSGVSAHGSHSISVLTTGKVPPLPSPGGRTHPRHPRRPVMQRTQTHSPTILGSPSVAKDGTPSVNGHAGTPAPAIPTPPAPPPESPPSNTAVSPPRVASPHPPRKPKKPNGVASPGAAFGGLIEGTVPPINVLIVEDNVINQKLLEAFMKRLSVRWQCAPNGEVAVKKWRQGGFHLVLMDIQLPVMNGLEATKEIRRLERLNGIGVFSKTASGRSSAASTAATSPSENCIVHSQHQLREEDTLEDLSLFKSPVIIVALTASSLQSDRHEALAAGCNDFLTKPVGFPWLEQKVTEWGCMQALIDFEGWRKWRGYADSVPSIGVASGIHGTHIDKAGEPMAKAISPPPSTIASPTRPRHRAASKSGSDSAPIRPPLGPLGSSGSGSGSVRTDSPASFTTTREKGAMSPDIQELDREDS
ncbi:response regulator, putative [Paecilomyces variotii No. 5]|uniref:Response regulator, putative n=1 Tax=Byssochlamys spectabilis (strain No. 5 / NBRC 109023) TaxID=1356009 RepID=V5G9N4_BYSSN|nr:response regulator, putative [Paecilomyces variotii No. 5]